jgi:hypothetical protein
MNAPGFTQSSSPSPVYVSGWIAVGVALLVLVALFAVYYQTIGYYIQIGWDKLMLSRDHKEKVQVDIPNGPSMLLTPTDSTTTVPLDSDVEKALGPNPVQVFNVNRNIYRFSEAEPLCRAFGAELATYDQVKDAYKSGADWCNYGWIKGQLAVYPTQKETYDKLQKGPEQDRMSCGLPGVNGGHFPNEDQRFGVTCYGPRPVETALDERIQKPENSDIAFDREVSRFKAQRDTIAVTPWSSTKWSA